YKARVAAKITTRTNQRLSPMAMRIRVPVSEANPIDNAATTMAAEAVNSMEPTRSVFIAIFVPRRKLASDWQWKSRYARRAYPLHARSFGEAERHAVSCASWRVILV